MPDGADSRVVFLPALRATIMFAVALRRVVAKRYEPNAAVAVIGARMVSSVRVPTFASNTPTPPPEGEHNDSKRVSDQEWELRTGKPA